MRRRRRGSGLSRRRHPHGTENPDGDECEAGRDDGPAASERTLTSSFFSLGAEAAAEADDPTASPCVVTGKACPIYASQTTGTATP